jgi:DNA polymerase-3 subunit gamma/tau
MQNLVLYRKYRPKSFSEVIGQEHVVRTLKNAIEAGTVSHAYLFSGPRGSGKTSIARILAKAVNCQNRNGSEPCNKCSSCLEIDQGKAVDLIEIDAASNRGVDEMRELREGIGFSPSRLKYKVFIIDECHQLTKEASNALLKTLEEPPSHAIFILATTEANKMIPTIISRCQRFDFRKLTLKEIEEKLERISKAEKVKIEKEALHLISAASTGSARDAESLLDQVLSYGAATKKEEITALEIKDLLGLVDLELVSKMVDLILERKKKEAINFLNDIFSKGKDPQEFARSLISYLRQILILQINVDFIDEAIGAFTKEEKEKIQQQVKSFKEDGLRTALRLFLKAENEMKYSFIPQLPLELAVIESLKEEGK